MTSFLGSPYYRALDANGNPISGAKLYIYGAGTTTPSTTYQDSGLSSAHASPVVADSAGYFPTIYMNPGNYKYVLKTSADVTLWTQDNISPALSGDGGVLSIASGGTGASTAAGARTALGAASAADLSSFSTSIADIENQIDNIGGTLGDLAGADVVTTAEMSGVKEVCIQSSTVSSSSASAITSSITNSPSTSSGTQVLTTSFTPISATSTLEFILSVTTESVSGSPNYRAIALLIRGDTNAIFGSMGSHGTGDINTNTLVKRLASPGTSAVTFSVRLGRALSSSNSFYFNANSYGGAVESFLTIRELVNT